MKAIDREWRYLQRLNGRATLERELARLRRKQEDLTNDIEHLELTLLNKEAPDGPDAG